MPSVMDIQQQQAASSNASGKTTPPPTSASNQQTTDPTNADPLTQAVLALDKKQRNLGKRKEKLESYQDEAKKGKELNKDQKEALQKYPEVLGQIEVLKEFNEQLKKIQAETAKNQKRLSKQATEEKRSLLSQNLRQYAQIRYLIEHRPAFLQSDESTLLDQLSASVIPTDNSAESISRSVDTVLSIYQNGPATMVKNLTGKTPQEVRETLENLFKNLQSQSQPQQPQQQVEVEEIPPASLPSSQQEQEPVETVEQQQQAPEQTNVLEEEQENNHPNLQSSSSTNRMFSDYPLQFDTRNQNIPLDQLMQDTTFFSIDSNNQLEDENQDQTNDSNQFIQTITVVNSNINDQPSTTSLENNKQDEQRGDEQWQQRRGSASRGGQFNGNSNRNYNRRGANYYHQSQRGGPRGGRYENSYGGNQRPYNDQSRGRGGYRGNRGGGYRGYHNNNNTNNNNNGNGYQKPAQYQQNHSAPPSQQAAQ